MPFFPRADAADTPYAAFADFATIIFFAASLIDFSPCRHFIAAIRFAAIDVRHATLFACFAADDISFAYAAFSLRLPATPTLTLSPL